MITRRKTISLLIVISACVLIGVSASLALPGASARPPDNVAATQAYVRARYELYRAIVLSLPESQTAVDGFVNRVVGECPNVLVGAPQGQLSLELGFEEVFLLGRVFVGPDERAGFVYADAVKHLRWTTPELTRLVDGGGAWGRTEAKLGPSDLCADLKAWAASGYHMLSAGTKRLLRRIRTEGSSEPSVSGGTGKQNEKSDEAIWRLLGPYETPSVKTLVRSVKQLEARVRNRNVDSVFSASLELSKRLGMKPKEMPPVAKQGSQLTRKASQSGRLSGDVSMCSPELQKCTPTAGTAFGRQAGTS